MSDLTNARISERNVQAVEVLRRLDEIGAIKLDVLLEQSAAIKKIVGGVQIDPEDGICYPFYLRIGPRHDIDLVSVAAELEQLGFQLRRGGA